MRIKNLLSRKFQDCDKTYQEEIEYLKSQSINIFTFAIAEETPDMYNARIKKQNERLKLRLLYFGGGILIALCGIIIMCSIMSEIHAIDKYKHTFLYSLVMFLPTLLSLKFLLKGISVTITERFTIRIDNTNCNFYELRMTSDGKWHIIVHQNFDGQNSIVQNIFATNVHIPFSKIYELQNIKSAQEDELGISIVADIRWKNLNMFQPDIANKFRYRDYYDYTIYIQKGTYSPDLPDLLECKIRGQRNVTTDHPYNSDAKEIDLCRHFPCDRDDASLSVMKRLVQYFMDAQGNYYSVQFFKGASYPHGGSLKQNLINEDLIKAQNKEWGYYYVTRFKQGYEDFNKFSGGEAKVISYPNFTLKKKGKKKSIYTYETNKKTKTIRISNSYVGLSDSLS